MVAESQGGISKLAKQTGIDIQILSKVFSCEDVPRMDILATIFTVLGCRLSIEPLGAEGCSAENVGVDASVAPVEGVKPDIALATDNK